MLIIDKNIDANVNLKVGDLLILKSTEERIFIGEKRLICKNGLGKYELVSLDDNEIIGYEYSTLESIYSHYKDDIVRVVSKDDMELILK